ncbi:MAG: hypothetical protein KIT61_09790 [Pyrinomonadaceae bacterium]|nr:hypothetical protein [Blastocatellia bacterium]MCW5956867.1 hypothetical protein [Pyrinomonadaceae bacterium]
MELLIPGLILVAIMAWASTRIKKNAAAAFVAETVETDEFVVEKPEGFLHVLNDGSGLAFRSYSKEFGTVGKKDIRQAKLEINIRRDTTIEEVRNEIAERSESVESEQPYLDGGEKATVLMTKKTEDGAEFDVLTKLVTRGNNVYEARASVLSEYSESILSKLEEAIERLRIK